MAWRAHGHMREQDAQDQSMRACVGSDDGAQRNARAGTCARLRARFGLSVPGGSPDLVKSLQRGQRSGAGAAHDRLEQIDGDMRRVTARQCCA
jgi:hypothetical protein